MLRGCRRFLAQRAEIAKIYDERFCRMWVFHLAGAEMAFRHDNQVVFQAQLARRLEALPLARDYMLDAERKMTFAGSGSRPIRAA